MHKDETFSKQIIKTTSRMIWTKVLKIIKFFFIIIILLNHKNPSKNIYFTNEFVYNEENAINVHEGIENAQTQINLSRYVCKYTFLI